MIRQAYKRGDSVSFIRFLNGVEHRYRTTVTNATFLESQILVYTTNDKTEWLKAGWHYSVTATHYNFPMLVHESELKLIYKAAPMTFKKLMESFCDDTTAGK